jgi:hypothetical protein
MNSGYCKINWNWHIIKVFVAVRGREATLKVQSLGFAEKKEFIRWRLSK